MQNNTKFFVPSLTDIKNKTEGTSSSSFSSLGDKTLNVTNSVTNIIKDAAINISTELKHVINSTTEFKSISETSKNNENRVGNVKNHAETSVENVTVAATSISLSNKTGVAEKVATGIKLATNSTREAKSVSETLQNIVNSVGNVDTHAPTNVANVTVSLFGNGMHNVQTNFDNVTDISRTKKTDVNANISAEIKHFTNSSNEVKSTMDNSKNIGNPLRNLTINVETNVSAIVSSNSLSNKSNIDGSMATRMQHMINSTNKVKSASEPLQNAGNPVRNAINTQTNSENSTNLLRSISSGNKTEVVTKHATDVKHMSNSTNDAKSISETLQNVGITVGSAMNHTQTNHENVSGFPGILRSDTDEGNNVLNILGGNKLTVDHGVIDSFKNVIKNVSDNVAQVVTGMANTTGSFSSNFKNLTNQVPNVTNLLLNKSDGATNITQKVITNLSNDVSKSISETVRNIGNLINATLENRLGSSKGNDMLNRTVENGLGLIGSSKGNDMLKTTVENGLGHVGSSKGNDMLNATLENGLSHTGSNKGNDILNGNKMNNNQSTANLNNTTNITNNTPASKIDNQTDKNQSSVVNSSQKSNGTFNRSVLVNHVLRDVFYN